MKSTLQLFLLLLAGAHFSYGVKFQVYRDLHHKGLIYDLNDPEADASACYDLKSYAQGMAASVMTDTCMLAYAGAACAGNSFKIMPPGSTELNKNIVSFHLCNETYGGAVIRADFYRSNNLLVEYNDVCGCQDLPTTVSADLTRINNYGNCITVYSSSNCGGNAKDIAAGINPDSLDLTGFGIVRSISACGRNPACIKLESKIFKFFLDFEASNPGAARNVELSAKTTFFNNGSATVTQEYHASKTTTETFTVTRSRTVAQMASRSVEHNFATEVSAGFSLFGLSASTTISQSLKEAYSFGASEENSNSDSYEHSEEKTFSVTQTIAIPPCVEYEVSSMLSMYENVPVPYWIYAKVTGTSSGRPIPAQDLEQHVEGMVFEEIVDDYTAVFKSRHVLQANVGVDTWISGEGMKIDGCETLI